MEFQSFPKIPRYSRECVISEKIDGTNAQIYINETGTNIWVGSRNRWISPVNDNYGFARWVADNSNELIKLGPGRHFGEWWGQGIQRGYGLKEKRFSLFNVKKWADPLVRPACCYVVPVIGKGEFTTHSVMLAMELLRAQGSFAAPGFMRPEGIIIFHTAGSVLFKKTFENDEKGKGEE